MYRFKVTTAATFVFLAVTTLLGACDPNAVTLPTDPPPPAPTQTEGTVHVEGDSVTWQSAYFGGDYSFASSVNATIGASVHECPSVYVPGCRPAMQVVPETVDNLGADVVVTALGLNDVNANGGWDDFDVVNWTHTFQNELPAETCLVIVLPGVLPPAGGRNMAEMAEMREWMINFAAGREHSVVLDYQAVVNNNPWVLDEDGVHVAANPTIEGMTSVQQDMLYAADQVNEPADVVDSAARVRANFIRSGVEQCQVTA